MSLEDAQAQQLTIITVHTPSSTAEPYKAFVFERDNVVGWHCFADLDALKAAMSSYDPATLKTIGTNVIDCPPDGSKDIVIRDLALANGWVKPAPVSSPSSPPRGATPRGATPASQPAPKRPTQF
jgi:hypothetical protein